MFFEAPRQVHYFFIKNSHVFLLACLSAQVDASRLVAPPAKPKQAYACDGGQVSRIFDPVVQWTRPTALQCKAGAVEQVVI